MERVKQKEILAVNGKGVHLKYDHFVWSGRC